MKCRTHSVWICAALSSLAPGQSSLDPIWQRAVPAPIVWAAPMAPANADAALIVALADGRWLALDAATGIPRGPLLDLGPGLAPLNADAAAPQILVASAPDRLAAVTAAPELALSWERHAGTLDPALFQGDPEYLPLWRATAASDRYVAALKTTSDACVLRLADGSLRRTLFVGAVGDARLCLRDDQIAVLGNVGGQPRVAFSAVTQASSYALGTRNVLAAWLTPVGLAYATLNEIGVVRTDGTRETRTMPEPLQAMRLALDKCPTQADSAGSSDEQPVPFRLVVALSQRMVAYDVPTLEQVWAIDLPEPAPGARLAAANGVWHLVNEAHLCTGTCDGRAAHQVRLDAARVLGAHAGDDGEWAVLQRAEKPLELLSALKPRPLPTWLRGAPPEARTAQWLPGYCFIVAQQQVCGYKLPRNPGAADGGAAQGALPQAETAPAGPASDRPPRQ